MCHHHASAAVALATELIQCISDLVLAATSYTSGREAFRISKGRGIPFTEAFLIDNLDKLLPEVTSDLHTSS